MDYQKFISERSKARKASASKNPFPALRKPEVYAKLKKKFMLLFPT
jgi:hypothetical protein